MAEQTVLRPGASAEISLAPEELGHLRLTVEGSEGALRIVIEAARPETADLLRRHAETLRQELRQEGLGSVNVSIGGGDARRGGGEAPPQPGGGGGQAPAGPFARAPAMKPGLPSFPPAVRPRAAGGHLDLRF